MSTATTHVLDAALGRPAATVGVTLYDPEGRAMTTMRTDHDGRIAFDVELGEGTHRLVFDTGAYFAAADRDTFFPEVSITFAVDAEQARHHVALLLSPFAYTTYRGS